MYLAEVSINQYRSVVRPLRFSCSPGLNIFIGQNNSGKTNILNAIQLTIDPKGQKAVIGYPEATVEVTLSDGSALRYPGITTAKNSYVSTSIRISSSQEVDYDRIDRDYQSLYRKYPQRFEQLQQAMRTIFPTFEPSETIISSRSKGLQVREGTETYILERLGTGFQRVFQILLAVYHPDYKIIFLDEPEAHLHPILIKRLAAILATKSENQIFLTTHSPLFIRPQWLSSLYRVVRSETSGTEIFSIRQSRVKLEQRRLLQELNADNLEIFFADTVLLVEGISDRILLRGLIDRFYAGVKEIKVTETNGKGNMDIFSDLLEAFHIPYHILVDADAWGFWAVDFARRRNWLLPRQRQQAVAELWRHGVSILPSGTIERYYPQKYQREKKKPLNAMRAAAMITPTEYRSPLMEPLRRLIQSL